MVYVEFVSTCKGSRSVYAFSDFHSLQYPTFFQGCQSPSLAVDPDFVTHETLSARLPPTCSYLLLTSPTFLSGAVVCGLLAFFYAV